jgi:CPA2 family monovalent cation:H+ antiporter-2
MVMRRLLTIPATAMGAALIKAEQIEETKEKKPHAIIIGYGVVGRALAKVLEDFEIEPRIIDLNLKTIETLRREGKKAIYGDGSQTEILRQAGLYDASYVLVTPPDLASRIGILVASATTNPSVKVISRAHYLGEKSMLEECQASGIVYEELEVATGLVSMLLRDLGATEDLILEEQDKIRAEVLG